MNIIGGSVPFDSRGGDVGEDIEDGVNDMDIPYRYRILTVKSNFALMSLSPIIMSKDGSLRIHLMSHDHTLRTTRTDMAPDLTTASRKLIVQTNLLHHYGITRGIMGVQNSSPLIPGHPEKYYLNVSDFGLEADPTFFDFGRYLDRLLIGFVMDRANYELLTGYYLPPDAIVDSHMASHYLKRGFTTYRKVKLPSPTSACSFSFSFYFRPSDGNPQLGIFYRSTPKEFRTMEELIAMVPPESRVKLIVKPCIYLINNYAGMNEAAQRLYRHEGVPSYTLQVIFQICTINVDRSA